MRSRAALIAAAVASLVVLQLPASAAWAATGTGNGAAAATSVNRATAPTATQVGSTVRLDWAAVTLNQGTPATGYTVLRHAGPGAPTQVCTAVAPTLTCTDSAPVQGPVQYGVVATYQSWTGQESPVTPFSLDVLPPLTSVTSNPAPNAAGWNNSAVTITLNATDASGVANVTYKIGSGSPVTVAGSSASFGVSAQGSTTITYYASDIFGNVESTNSYTVKIDSSAPTSPAITAISNDSGTAGDRITNVAAQTLTGTAEAGATVTVSRGATTYPSVVAAANGTYSVPVTLAQGANSFTAVAVDPAGNTSPASAAFVVTLDTTALAPAITAISNDSGVAGDRITNVATQTLTGTAEAGSTVTISRGATTYPSVVAAANGTYSVPGVTLAQGANSFTAVAVDPAGNTSPASAAFVVTLDTAAPARPTITAISNDSGVAGDRITNVATQTLTGTAEAGSTVTISRGATTYPSVVAAANGTYSVPGVTLAQGANSFTAVAVDPAGNTSPTSTAFVVTLDTTAPTLTITDPQDGVDYRDSSGPKANRWAETCGGAPGACGTSSDSGSGVTLVTLELRDTTTNTCWTGTGTTYGGCGSAVAATGTTAWSKGIAYGVVAGRSLRLTITVTDLAGNVATGTVNFTAQ